MEPFLTNLNTFKTVSDARIAKLMNCSARDIFSGFRIGEIKLEIAESPMDLTLISRRKEFVVVEEQNFHGSRFSLSGPFKEGCGCSHTRSKIFWNGINPCENISQAEFLRKELFRQASFGTKEEYQTYISSFFFKEF